MFSDIWFALSQAVPLIGLSRMKQPGKLTVDLGDLKPAWLAYCAANKLTASTALRQVVRRLVERAGLVSAPAPVEPEEDADKRRVSVRLLPREMAEVQTRAEAEGFSVPAWIVSLIRAQMTQDPQFGQRELEALAESNHQLLAIGRNLNQIARHLNAQPEKLDDYRPEVIEELAAMVKEHTRKVAEAMQTTVDRWAK
jgi:hypothetical protein